MLCCRLPRANRNRSSWGFQYALSQNVSVVQDHMCQVCGWNGECTWAAPSAVTRYGVDEFGSVPIGEHAMMAEIYARGPISCSIDSDPDAFDLYVGCVCMCRCGRR
jgi:hypothetical protein